MLYSMLLPRDRLCSTGLPCSDSTDCSWWPPTDVWLEDFRHDEKCVTGPSPWGTKHSWLRYFLQESDFYLISVAQELGARQVSVVAAMVDAGLVWPDHLPGVGIAPEAVHDPPVVQHVPLQPLEFIAKAGEDISNVLLVLCEESLLPVIQRL